MSTEDVPSQKRSARHTALVTRKARTNREAGTRRQAKHEFVNTETATRSFIPAGSYHPEKYPELERLLESWESRS